MRVQFKLNRLNAMAGAVGVVVLGGAMLAASTSAPARTNFDGAWSVLVITDYGSCERAYRYGVQIVNGRVLSDGEAGVNISGRVSPRGQVNVEVRQGNQQAVGAGRLSQATGGGRWKGASPDQQCGGHWTAQRRSY
jgi:hypothetical protein